MAYVRIFEEPTRLKIEIVGEAVRYENKIGLSEAIEDEQLVLRRNGTEVLREYFYNFLKPEYRVEQSSARELLGIIQTYLQNVPENIEGQTEIVKTAGENINGGRAVVVENDLVYLFNPNNPAHYGRIVGISNNSALIGEDSYIVMLGIVTGLSTLVKDLPVYAVLNGELSNTPVVSGISQIVGVALSETEMLIQQRIPINK